MDIHHPALTAAAIVAMSAVLCGGLMTRFRQPAIVGYILAGVVLGPSGLALVSNRDAISTLAEFGVLMLLFVVGMRLDLRRFMAVWKIALVATCLQIAGSVGAALLLRQLLGWSPGLAVVLGCAVAISSTAVVIKILESSEELDTPVGRTTVAILIAQDMAVVPMMLVLEAMETRSIEPMDAGRVVLSLLILALLVWGLSRRKLVLPLSSRLIHDVDLSTLAALTWCFGAAALSGMLDMSPAYGAFLGGVILGNTAESDVLLKRAQPVKSVLLMVFFLSIGLLLDLKFIWRNLGTVLLLLAMVTVFKTALNVMALRLLRQDWPSAFLAGVALAQIGEFSFLLADTGRASHLISAQETKLVVAVTVLSLVLSPFWLFTMRRMHRVAQVHVASFRELIRGLYGEDAQAMARVARKTRQLTARVAAAGKRAP